MSLMIYGVILVMMAFIFMKNFTLLKRYKHNKEYIACYRDILNNEDNCYERIIKYIDDEKSEEFKNKGRILNLYVELKNDLDFNNSLNSLDLRYLFFDKNNRLDRNLLTFNSDSFIFIMMAMFKAFSKNKLDVINALNDKLNNIDELKEYLECSEIKAVHDCLLSIDDSGINFMSNLLNGDYLDYKYDKNMIGIYKRVAAACLTYKSQTIDEYYHDDLRSFAKSKIGKEILSDLKLYDKYIISEQEALEAEE